MSDAVCSWYKSIPCVGVGDALSTLVAQVSTPIQHTHKSAFPSIVELGISCSPNSSLSASIFMHSSIDIAPIIYSTVSPVQRHTSHRMHDIPPLQIQLFRFSSQFTSPGQDRRLLDIYYTSQSASSQSSPTSTSYQQHHIQSQGVLTSVTVIGRHLDDCVRDRRRRMSSKSKSKSFPEVFVVAVFRLRLSSSSFVASTFFLFLKFL